MQLPKLGKSAIRQISTHRLYPTESHAIIPLCCFAKYIALLYGKIKNTGIAMSMYVCVFLVRGSRRF
jgi:hypothetical protein